MNLKVSVQLQSPVLQRPEALREALEPVVAQAAAEVERDVKEQMSGPHSGRTYRRGVIGRRVSKATKALGLRERATKRGGRIAIAGFTFHRASAPGEAPAVDLGQLINSILASGEGLRWSVGTPLATAQYLEEGTRRMAPRPAFGPAADRARETFPAKVDEAVKGVL